MTLPLTHVELQQLYQQFPETRHYILRYRWVHNRTLYHTLFWADGLNNPLVEFYLWRITNKHYWADAP